jgi:G:T-mismatch repair DNA endonuclease (very short patch repair protein)
VIRDRKNRQRLRRLGWGVLIVWECHIKKDKLHKLQNKLCEFLDD